MATRRARYGTVISPTSVASNRETEARMTAAHTFPASRDTVEKSAAANAIPKPTSARKNFTQRSAAADCSHWVRRAAVDGLDFMESEYVECTARSLTSAEKNEQSPMACAESRRNLHSNVEV